MSGVFMMKGEALNRLVVFNTNLKSVFVVVLLSIVSCLSSFSQTVSQLTKAGDKKIEEGDYYAASQYYRDALKKDEENIDLNFKYAEACRMFNDLDGSNYGYRAVIKLDKANQYPMAHFWLGEVLRSTCECKCEEAQKLFHRFQTKYRKKDFYYAKAQQEIEACAWVKDHAQKVDSVKIEHLGKEVNTPQSEFNAMHVFPDKIQFSSLRNIGDKKNEKYLVRIYNQPPNPEVIYMPNGAKQELNIGNGAYTPDSRKFFFTQCEQKDKSTTRCDIYVSKYQDFKWTPAEKLDTKVNEPTATNTQPAVGYDLEGNEILFFSSDREGGKGKMDIWLSKLNSDGTYSQAVNAGEKINTQGNEITPFYDVNYRKLYFSSDWHYGFGGYDIFETAGENTNWSAPKNLLQPINTPQNDLYYTRAIDNSKAFITSNRKGSYFIEAETCCNDIYAYNTGNKLDRRDTPVPVTIKTDTPVVAVKIDTPAVVASIDTPKVLKADTPVIAFNAIVAPKEVKAATEPPKFIDERIKKVKQLLPVQLYFHNDEPDAKTLNDTTRLDYRQTYEAYAAQRFEYEREYPKSLPKADRENGAKEIRALFADKVDAGYYNLVAFSAQLLELLQQGNKLDITIKGYCSPLNFNEYNIKLGYRRVASLRNYFFHYREGILLPYIANGSLTLKTESLGEETAARNISDNREDKPNSVYNPAAAVERRVEIISVELK
jgi:hypothetical protein